MRNIKQAFVISMVLVLALLIAACGGGGSQTGGPSGGNGGGAGTGGGTGSGNGAGSAGETITLRAATGLSPQHGWWAGTVVPWMDRVTELTEGRVQFETFTGGELVSVPDEADAVLNGTIDVGLILPIYQPDQYPMAEVTMLPVAHSDVFIGSKAWRALVESDIALADGKTYYDMQFSAFKVFPVSATEEYSISTTGHEFNSVNDVVGISLRTPSRIHEMYSEKIGINSITMPAVEMFDALSRGAFEGSYYSIADWSGYGFQELFRYTLRGINFGHFNALIAMTQEKWNSLPADVQAAMEQAYEDVFLAGAEEWKRRSDEMVEQNTADGGKFVDFSTLDPAVQAHFTQGIVETWLDYAKLLEDQGLPGTELIKLWRDLLLENGGDVPDEIKNL